MIRELKFEMICRLHSDEMYRYARNLTGDAGHAEDFVQEALLRLWKNIDAVGVRQSRAWLYRTTRNLCCDHLRRAAHQAAPVYPGAEAMATLCEELPEESPAGTDQGELSQRIDAALLRLSELQRSVFVLHEINGLRYREIADHLEIPLNSVKVHLLRARRRLQSLLKDQATWINA